MFWDCDYVFLLLDVDFCFGNLDVVFCLMGFSLGIVILDLRY